jgi:acyl-CoA thioester hydrolase
MGIVYHTHFLDYFEEARTEALREAGLPYKTLEASGVMTPIVEASLHYHAPAHYDDLLEIETVFEEPPRARIATSYAVRRAGEDAVLVTGHVLLCFVDVARRRPVAAPAVVRDAFERAARDAER